MSVPFMSSFTQMEVMRLCMCLLCKIFLYIAAPSCSKLALKLQSTYTFDFTSWWLIANRSRVTRLPGDGCFSYTEARTRAESPQSNARFSQQTTRRVREHDSCKIIKYQRQCLVHGTGAAPAVCLQSHRKEVSAAQRTADTLQVGPSARPACSGCCSRCVLRRTVVCAARAGSMVESWSPCLQTFQMCWTCGPLLHSMAAMLM